MAKKRVITAPEGAQAIGQRLPALRKAKGLVSKYERGDLLLHGELIVRFDTVLRASADDIVGLQRVVGAHTAAAVPLVEKTLARRLAQLQSLPRRNGDALLSTLDALLLKPHAA